MMKIEFDGLEELANKLENTANNVEKGKDEALLAGAKVMQEATKKLAPVRAVGGGNLKDHVNISDVEDGEIQVYVDQQGKAYYGYFHEIGTSKMRARPFMGPAFNTSKHQIERAIADKIKQRFLMS